MRKRTKLRRINSTKSIPQLIKIEQAICDSHLKEKLNEESRAVTKIKSDPNYFFRYAKKNSICNRNIGPLLNPNTHLITNDRLEMCSLDQFYSVFTSPKPEMIVHDPVSFFSCQSIIPSDDYYLTDIEIDETIIIDAINAIPPLLLINCAAELAPALKLLFTQSLMHGFIPTSFKSAVITPVFKSGIKTSPCNYRPISLTSTIIKVFERIVRKQVVAFLTRRGHLNNTQHGFRSGRSCLSALPCL